MQQSMAVEVKVDLSFDERKMGRDFCLTNAHPRTQTAVDAQRDQYNESGHEKSMNYRSIDANVWFGASQPSTECGGGMRSACFSRQRAAKRIDCSAYNASNPRIASQ
jgi:hypothetical protein